MKTLKVRVKYVISPKIGSPPNTNNWVSLSVEGNNGVFTATGNILESHKAIKLTGRDITITGEKGLYQGKPTFKCSSIEVIQANDFHAFLVDVIKTGKTCAAEMMMMFGDDLSNIISQHPDKLLTVKGVSKKKLAKIVKNWRLHQSVRGISELLLPLGVSSNMINNIHAHFGSDAPEIVKNDPHRLIFVPGMTFKAADEIAFKIGIAATALSRACGASIWGFKEIAESSGNTAITTNQLIAAVARFAPEISEALIHEAIENLLKNEDVIELDDGTLSSYHYYALEQRFRDYIHARNIKRKCLAFSALVTDSFIPVLESLSNIVFSTEQREAIRIAGSGAFTFAVRGHAGTGKSTIAKALFHLYLDMITDHTPKFLCLALSGVAADRIRQLTGYPAQTIHSALGWIPGEEGEPGTYRHHKRNPLVYDVILIDESSMIDSQLMCDLLDAISATTRLIFLGDDAQLPPIGPADVFRDLLGSGLIPVAHLTEIFRQSDNSALALFANIIRQGQVPDNYAGEWEDFRFDVQEHTRMWNKSASGRDVEIIKSESLEMVVERILTLSADAKKWIKDPIRDFQVLSPMRIGPLGADVLNKRLQTIFNPQSPTLACIETKDNRFQLDDKVVHLHNEDMNFLASDTYDDFGKNIDFDTVNTESMRICNGFIGIIVFVAESGKSLCVRYPTGTGNIVVQYSRHEVANLLGLAYALSVHKYQGSEAKQVVIPIHSSQSSMLTNRWLYTAVTRAKEMVTLVGQRRMFEVACKTMDKARRQTVLQRLAQ